jgi:hypothetical protein
LILLFFLFCCSCKRSDVIVARIDPVSSSSHSGTRICGCPIHHIVIPNTPPPEIDLTTLVNYILLKDNNWLTINNLQVNAIADGFNARIQEAQKILLLCAEAILLHDACEEYISNPLMPYLNEKMDIYDEAIGLANQETQALLYPRNNMNNVVREVSNLLAADFLLVDAVARDAIALPGDAASDHEQQVAELLQCMTDIKAAIQMLEQAIAFVRNVNEKQLRCRDTLGDVPIILGGNNDDFTIRIQNMPRNITSIERVVFSKTETRLSRFHIQISGDLNNAVENAELENIIAQLESIRYNEGFIDFIETVNSLTRVIQE